MRRIFAFMLAAALFMSAATALAPGDVLGWVLYTDVVAYIDGVPVRSYNIEGNTYVVAEDLAEYGFGVEWNGATSTLHVTDAHRAVTAEYVPEANTHPAGTPAMPYLYTNVKTVLGGEVVTGYNIGGFTCVCMDDLAAYCASDYVWDGAASELRLTRRGSKPAPVVRVKETGVRIRSAYWPIREALAAAEAEGNGTAYVSAVEELRALYDPPRNYDEYSQLAYPTGEVARILEARGEYSAAADYYESFYRLLTVLSEYGDDCYDLLRVTEAQYRHCAAAPQVFAVTASDEGILWGSTDLNGAGNARLLYAHFFTENFADFFPTLPKGNYTLEAAWNLPGETFDELDEIAAGRWDAYIVRNLNALEGLGRPVLLRFAAEANNFADLPGDRENCLAYAEVYKAAYRHVAELAHIYAPSATLVWSVNDICNWYVDYEDFYPGDDVVDWVGVSTYMMKYGDVAGDGTDAVYCRGRYDNQLERLRPLMDLAAERDKPVLISECGFCRADGSGRQSAAYAAKKLKEFYSCVTMLYPQVKGILYFDETIGGQTWALGSGAVRRAYDDAVAAMPGTSGGRWVPLAGYAGGQEEVTLALYVGWPSEDEPAVEWYLDGVRVPADAEMPFTCRLTLTPGAHTVSVRLAARAESWGEDYTIYGK